MWDEDGTGTPPKSFPSGNHPGPEAPVALATSPAHLMYGRTVSPFGRIGGSPSIEPSGFYPTN
jgi:hypothetical protein